MWRKKTPYNYKISAKTKTVLHFPKQSHRLFRLQEQYDLVSFTLSS